MPALILFLILVGVPALEIALFIQIGGEIGVWGTLGAIFLTAVIGVALVKAQGVQVITDLRLETEAGKPPVETLVRGTCLVFAGLFLLTPGFFTDAIGFILLLPPLQSGLGRKVVALLMKHSSSFRRHQSEHGPHGAHGPAQSSRPSTIIEGDFEEVQTANERDQSNPRVSTGENTRSEK